MCAALDIVQGLPIERIFQSNTGSTYLKLAKSGGDCQRIGKTANQDPPVFYG
ncbi:MAG: hypothetical protein WCA39_02965 [Nitrososphaeraceae archaeon]